ncbi:MAG: asparaginase [Nitriliruptoraceae bacterium]
MLTGPVLAEVTRRDVRTGVEHVESVHAGSLVVARPEGSVLLSAGAPDLAVFPRSAVKPLQAAVGLELLDDAAPTSGEIAVAWASHRGEPAQLAAVQQLLVRAGRGPEELTCPPAVAEATPGATPSRLQHNCSGKHALFALAGRSVGVAGVALLDPDGPLQRVVLDRLGTWLGPVAGHGVDGCGAPAVVVPLHRLAAAFAALAVAPRLEAVRDAGLTHPDLVGGQGRLESALLGAGVVAKVGAEGVYAAGFLAADGSPAGLAIKAADGATRGVAAVVAFLLETANIVPPGTWVPSPPLGGGRPAGQVRPTALVHELADQLAGWVASGDR